MADKTIAAATQPAADAIVPVISPSLPVSKRVKFMIRLLAYKILVRITLGIARFFGLGGFGKLKPAYHKTYAVGAHLLHDVWLPSSYKKGDVLPLYIDIHGGGFALGDPALDSSFCHYLAEKHGICVVSINYRKAPWCYFPHQTQDVVDSIQQVLQDPDLPADKTKVAVGGFSAGGNLALSAALRDELQGKIQGLLPWYPVTDFTSKFKGKYRPMRDGNPDVLVKTSELFNYGYVSPGQDRTDPYLSPVYADRSRLPPKMFFVTAEYDVLCNEAAKTAERYAAAEQALESKTGSADDWTAGGIRYLMMHDVQHGFNFRKQKNPELEAIRLKAVEKAYAESAAWLKRQVYA